MSVENETLKLFIALYKDEYYKNFLDETYYIKITFKEEKFLCNKITGEEIKLEI